MLTIHPDITKAVMSVMNEARDSKLIYKETKTKGEVTKVIVELKGKSSEKFTKMINRYSELQKAIDTLTTEREKQNAQIKDEFVELFDAEDEVLTKVGETVSATLTLAKKTEVTATKVDYDKVVAALNEMVPELTDKIKELIKSNTTTNTSIKSSALRITPTDTDADKEKASKVKKVVNEMAMDTIMHPKYGRIAWENNDGLHQIKRQSDNKVALSGNHEEVAAAWKKLKTSIEKFHVGKVMAECIKLEFVAEAQDTIIGRLKAKFTALLNSIKEWSSSFSKDLSSINTILKRI